MLLSALCRASLVACCSAVLDSPTNGTCSCVLLPQLLGTLDKETMLPCTDRGSAHNQTNVPLVLSVAQCSARNSAVVSATAGWLNQWGTSWSRSSSVRAVISKLRHEEGLAHPLAGQRQWCGPCRAPCASTCATFQQHPPGSVHGGRRWRQRQR